MSLPGKEKEKSERIEIVITRPVGDVSAASGSAGAAGVTVMVASGGEGLGVRGGAGAHVKTKLMHWST